METGRRILVIVLSGVAVILFLLVVALFIFTATDWGRDQARQLVVNQLRSSINGEVEVGRLEGHLLDEIRLIDVSIVDSAGRPFIRADTLATQYSLRALLSQRIHLNDVRLVHADIVLDRAPGEDWNFVSIFRSDGDTISTSSRWGEWIELRDILLIDSRITMRTEWEPPPDLSPTEEQEAIRAALAGETRDNVIEVAGGLQNVMEFRDLNAELSRVLVAHPDTASIPVDVVRFSGIAQPFTPPAADVRNLSGNFRLQGDTLYFRNVNALLPDSRLSGDGFYSMEHSELRLGLEGAPVALDDLRWLYPPLPEEGGGTLEIDLRLRPLTRHIIVREMDLRIGDSELQGKLDVQLGDTLRIQDTDLQFARLDTRLIERMAPDLTIPRHGRMTGSVEVAGRLADLELDADVTFDDYAGGTSRVLATGGISAEQDVRFEALRVEMRPLRMDLVRAFAPNLPISGAIEGSAHLTGTLGDRMQLESDFLLRDPQSGVSRVAAVGGIAFGDGIRFDDLQARFDPIQLDLLRDMVPDLPAGATASGPLRLDGRLDGLLQIDGDFAIDDPASGVSRIAARGGIDLRDELRFQQLDLQLDPLNTGLLRGFAPEFPLGGILSGTATVTGSPSEHLSFVADLEHLEGGERSHLTGRGEVAMTPGAPFDIVLQLHPLSMQTAGRFAPGAGLRGRADGRLALSGTLADLHVDADLTFDDGGSLDAVGRLDLASTETGYDMRLTLNAFDPSALSTKSPVATSLAGTVVAEGRGFDPATMQAVIRADLKGLEVDEYAADEVRLRVEIDRGLAIIDTAVVRMRSAEAQIAGTLGLQPELEGALTYRVRVDSLHMLAPWIPPADTGVVVPRPAVREAARAEAERAARDAEVEFLATGELPELNPDTSAVMYVPRDSLGGSLVASGTIRGSIDEFDAEGQAVVEDFVFQGNYVGRGDIDYRLVDVRTEDADAQVDASFESLLLGGYAFDAATLDATYRGGRYGSGDVELAIVRDEAGDLRLDSEFTLSLEQSELRLVDLEMRLDTVMVSTTGPATFRWGGDGLSVERLELQSTTGGRIFVDGELPVNGQADLEIVAQEIEIAYVMDLLQDNRDASGLMSLEARVQGTLENPVIEGEGSLVDATFNGSTLPNVRASFDYVDEALQADAILVHDSLEIATADVRIPIDLGIRDGGPRLLDRPMQIDIHADQLSLSALPAFTDQVESLDGFVVADISITGTPFDPTLEGDVSMDLTSFDFAPLGIRFEPLAGHVSLEGDVLRIDSLVAYSGGPARITGEVRFESLTNPVFDLEVEARDTWVIDTDDARLQLDADLTIVGPLESVEISGLVRTQEGVIYVPEMSEFGAAEVVDLDDPGTFERVDSLLRAQRDIVANRRPLFENFEAEIQVEINRDVWLRSTEANVEIYTPSDVGPLRITMQGLGEMPIIEGTINTDRGEYEYLSRRFVLTRGAVTFLGTEEIDPMLQLAAEHEVRIPGREALTIRIIVGGTLRDLQVTLESNAQPPISQTDLLSFLAFGREASTLIQGHGSSISGQSGGGAGLVGNVAGIATQQFTAIALESMLSGVEAEIGQDLGLDVIRITPAHLSADVFTGSYLDVLRGTEIEVGRYVSSRMFVAAQARPARTFPGILFEYRTRRDFEWSATWRSRFMPGEPTLSDPQAESTGVFGSFLFKEWRF